MSLLESLHLLIGKPTNLILLQGHLPILEILQLHQGILEPTHLPIQLVNPDLLLPDPLVNLGQKPILLNLNQIQSVDLFVHLRLEPLFENLDLGVPFGEQLAEGGVFVEEVGVVFQD